MAQSRTTIRVGNSSDPVRSRSPIVRRWTSATIGFLGRDSSKDLTDRLEIRHIAFCGSTGDLVEPANGIRLQARLAGITRRVDHFDLDLHGILAASHPALALFPAFFHARHSPMYTVTTFA